MTPNPLIGVLFHWLGGLCSASFYVPYKRARGWSWEIVWITGGVFSWIVAPWLFAAVRTRGLSAILTAAPADALFWCYFWGVIWGFGGLTFGLTMRYLGLSLGMAVALGLTTVIGTIGPPVYHGRLGLLMMEAGGRATLFGILVALCGIAVVGQAGRMRERAGETGTGEGGPTEFSLGKGLLIAIFSGIMSGAFAFGLDAAEPIRRLSLAEGNSVLSQGLPGLCIILAGGFTTNFLWCLLLILRNRSGGEFVGRPSRSGGMEPGRSALFSNYALAATGGTLWYLQFFFYTMGESQMGRFGFSSWTLHMASIILFSTLWGFALREWSGVEKSTRIRVIAGIGLLVSSTIIIGMGNYLSS